MRDVVDTGKPGGKRQSEGVTHVWRFGEKILQEQSETVRIGSRNWSGSCQRADFLGLP
jgi:hypothetical protein